MATQIADANSMCVGVPGNTQKDGIDFLESIAAGNVGGGIKMNSLGQTLPSIRTRYKNLISAFEKQLTQKQASGLSAKELSKWAVNERTRIALKGSEP